MTNTLSASIATALLIAAVPGNAAVDHIGLSQCAAVAAIFEHMWGLPDQKQKKPAATGHYAKQRAAITKQAVNAAAGRVGKSKATSEVNILIVRFVTHYMGDIPGRFQPQAGQCSSQGLIAAPV